MYWHVLMAAHALPVPIFRPNTRLRGPCMQVGYLITLVREFQCVEVMHQDRSGALGASGVRNLSKFLPRNILHITLSSSQVSVYPLAPVMPAETMPDAVCGCLLFARLAPVTRRLDRNHLYTSIARKTRTRQARLRVCLVRGIIIQQTPLPDQLQPASGLQLYQPHLGNLPLKYLKSPFTVLVR
jgi:hypothetical protein